jgi:hypothetical protein
MLIIAKPEKYSKVDFKEFDVSRENMGLVRFRY